MESGNFLIKEHTWLVKLKTSANVQTLLTPLISHAFLLFCTLSNQTKSGNLKPLMSESDRGMVGTKNEIMDQSCHLPGGIFQSCPNQHVNHEINIIGPAGY